MRGRHVFMESLLAHGAEYVFGNPGSTENSIVDGMLDYQGLSYVLALHEGVALGAANFYAMASGKTAVVNLHAAPGLGNAIGMMFGALKANTPMVVTSGQQDTRMRLRDPILRHDLAAMAAPVTKWSVEAQSADELSLIMRRAFKIANEPPCGPVFVALPLNVMEQETEIEAARPNEIVLPAAEAGRVEEAARLLLAAKNPVIVAGDGVAQRDAGASVARLAEATGAAVWFEPNRARVPVSMTHPATQGSVPFFGPGLRAAFEKADVIVFVGGMFLEELWYEAERPLPENAKIVHIDEARSRVSYIHPVDVALVGDLEATVSALGERVAAGAGASYRKAAEARLAALAAAQETLLAEQRARAKENTGGSPVPVAAAMAALREALPAETAVAEESITTRIDLNRTFFFDDPSQYFAGRGGGIGQAIAGALGVQLAFPGRPVAAISGDGSAMYSIQALWTAAHHDLPVLFVILANREYRVLKRNLDIFRQRFDINSNRPNPHMNLTEPGLDFVSLAGGMGVAGTHVAKAADIGPAVEAALASGKPHLIELAIQQ